jgi:hypothetical protein
MKKSSMLIGAACAYVFYRGWDSFQEFVSDWVCEHAKPSLP